MGRRKQGVAPGWVLGELPDMPLHKPTNDGDKDKRAAPTTLAFPPEAYQYDAELKVETVKLIQAKADKVLSQDEWVVIDGVDKR